MAKATGRRESSEEAVPAIVDQNDEGAMARLAAARADRAAREERLAKVQGARKSLADLYRQRDELNAQIAKHEAIVANPDSINPDLLEVMTDTLGPAGFWEKGDLLEVGEIMEKMPNADITFMINNGAVRPLGAAEARVYRAHRILSTSKPVTEFGETDFEMQTTAMSGAPGVSNRGEAATAVLEGQAARQERAERVMEEQEGEGNAL